MEFDNNDNGTDSSSFEDLTSPEIIKDEKVTENEEWMDILGSGSLKKKVLKHGEQDTRPQRNDICVVRIEGKLLDGTVVEKSDTIKIQVGDMEVIQGIDIAIPLMNVGEIALLQIEPRLAYGEEGLLPNILPNTYLIYEVELLSATPEIELEKISVLERKKIGNCKRERGNWWYSRNDSTTALQLYRRALDYLDEVEGGIIYPGEESELKPSDADLQDLLEDRMKVYNNMAAAQMKLQVYDAALKSVENVLRCQPQNVKALFRKAKILVEKGEVNEAQTVLKKALAHEPTNSAIQLELQRLTSLAQKHRKNERDLAKRMLQQPVNKRNDKSRISSIYYWAPIFGLVAVSIAAVSAYKYKFS